MRLTIVENTGCRLFAILSAPHDSRGLVTNRRDGERDGRAGLRGGATPNLGVLKGWVPSWEFFKAAALEVGETGFRVSLEQEGGILDTVC